MTVKIDGTNTVANPAFTGADTDTGLQVGTNEVNLVTGGTARAIVDSSGRVGVGTSAPYNVLTGKSLSIGNGVGSAELNFLSSTSGYNALYFGDGTSGNATYRGYLEFVHTDESMRFGTAASEKMRISSEGYVTKPSQPGIYLDGLDWSNTNNYMHNGHQFWQVGSNWNNTTGTWTCPVAGKYFVGADAQGHNTHTQTGASQQYANLVPRVNNGNVGLETVATTRADGGTGGGTATHTSFGFAIILSCNANDTIRVYSDHGFRTNSQNHLTIYLLG